MASKDLVFRFLGVDGGAGREFDRMAGKSASLEKAIGKVALGFTAAGLAIGVESVRAAAKFQQSMELIHTQAGRSQAAVDRMSKAVLQLAGPTATAPDELSKGLYHLASTGLSTKRSMEALAVAAKGAKMGQADLESVTNALNATIASGIRGAKNFDAAMGALNATVGSGDMRMQDLAEALGTGVLAAVKGFGLSLNDVGAALATFGDNNIRGADAATQLRMAVLFMAKPAATASKTLKELGLTSHTLADDMRERGLGGALEDLHKHLVKAGDTGAKMGQVLLDLFGHKAGTGIAILEQQFTRFQSKQQEVQKGSKNFASDWTAYTKTFGYSWDSAKSAFEAMTIELGQKLLPVATQAMHWIGTKGVADLDKFGGWVSRNKRPIEDLAKALIAIGAVRFTAGKINDLSRIFGKTFGGGGVLGGILGTAAKPVPVYVTNPGFKGPGGPNVPGGKGIGQQAEEDAKKYGPGAAAGATLLTRAAKVATALTTASGYVDPLILPAAMNTQDSGPKGVLGANRELMRVLNQFNVTKAGTVFGPSGKAVPENIAALVRMGRINQPDSVAAKMTDKAYIKSATGDLLADPKYAKRETDKLNQALTDEWTLHKKVGRASAEDARLQAQAAATARGAAKYRIAAEQATASAQRGVIHNVKTQLREIPGAWKTLAAEARAAGQTVGEQIDAGVVVGLQQGAGKVQIVGSQVVDGVLHRMNKTAVVTSPSKRSMYTARMIMEGLGVGLKQGMSMVEHMSQHVVDKVMSKLDALKGSRSGMAEGISANLIQASGLSNMPLASLTTAFGTSYTATPTVSGMRAFESAYLGRERAFARNLALAQKKGLTPGQRADIAQEGLDVGGPIAAALAGGTRTDVRGLSATLSQVTAVAQQIGTASAAGVYDRQIQLLEQLLAELKQLPHAVSQGVGNALKHPGTQKTLATSATRARRAK